jgi:hypothetical protein
LNSKWGSPNCFKPGASTPQRRAPGCRASPAARRPTLGVRARAPSQRPSARGRAPPEAPPPDALLHPRRLKPCRRGAISPLLAAPLPPVCPQRRPYAREPRRRSTAESPSSPRRHPRARAYKRPSCFPSNRVHTTVPHCSLRHCHRRRSAASSGCFLHN